MADEFFATADDGLMVLVVEDEQRLREMLLRAIPDMGFRAEGVSNAEQALKLLNDQPRQVLVLDLNLPGMSGLDLLEQVRERWPKVQAVVLTGYGDLDAAKKAIHLDVVEFLTKPYTLGDLERALDRARQRLMPEPGKGVSRQALFEEAPDAKESQPPAATAGPDAADTAAKRADADAASHDADHLEKLADIERKHILSALEKNGGNRAATARQLGISVRTLYYRLDEYRAQGHYE